MPHDVLIVGSGFSGLCTATRLRQAGVEDYVVLERADEVGGTWRDNRYPGCACDVPSHLYSYSFEPWPSWSRTYAEQPEILDYLRHCAEKYGVRPFVRFGADVREARWDESERLWHVRCADGRAFSGRALVMGTGALSNPYVPDLPGLDRFRGATFHSAAWDAGFDLRGKRVAVIGSGASAVQIVPEIASVVGRLDYYQRTPPWVMPRPDRAIPPRERALYRAVPLAQRLQRWAVYWRMESRVLAFVVEPRLMEVLRWVGRRHIARAIADPALRERVTPTYSPGCKRILLSNTYYAALARPHVEVVTDPIAEVTPTGVVTRDGRAREVDAILLATGFKVQEMVPPGAIVGAGGRDLHAVWAERGGAEAHLGITMHGFPNLFFLMGPNTGLGHNSMVYMIEAQVDYVLDALAAMRRAGVAAVDVRADVQTRFVEGVRRRLGDTVWASGCRSWYLNASGKNTTIWPGFTFVYRRLTRRFRMEDHEVRG